jgi:hypothetical protein
MCQNILHNFKILKFWVGIDLKKKKNLKKINIRNSFLNKVYNFFQK